VRHLKESQQERERQQACVAELKRRLSAVGLPLMPSASHIVPVLVGDPVRCKQITDLLLNRHALYVQPINYPTVPRGTERLRLTPRPFHNADDIERLVAALSEIWSELALKRAA